MSIDPRKFARMLGAEIVGELPDVGGGPFGMARLAHIMHECLIPSQGDRPGRPTNPNWSTRCKVPMSDATLRRLTQLAEDMSTMERKVSPMQVAAQLLEEAVGCLGAKTGSAAGKITDDAGPTVRGQSRQKPTKTRPRGDQPQDNGRTAGQRRKKV
jgi:hypothetical protein